MISGRRTSSVVQLCICYFSFSILASIPGVSSANTATLVQVPDTLDNLYRYNVNSTSDLVTYENTDGSLVQLYSYWSDDRRFHVTKRSFPDGEFEAPVDIHDAVMGTSEKLGYDSHNSTALGVASNGVIFASGNHHSSPLNMAKTQYPFDLSSFVNVPPEEMVAASEVDRVTYPSFVNHGGYLYFSYREQEAGSGAPRFRWMLNRYSPDKDKWETAAQFNTGIALRLYLSNIAVGGDGKGMHVYGVWRDDDAGGGVDSQRDYFHLFSYDGKNWRIKGSRTKVTQKNPLWYNNGNTLLAGYTGQELSTSEKIWEYPRDIIPRSAGVSGVDERGRPHALVRGYSGELYHHYYKRKRWNSNELQNWQAHSFDIVTCPDSEGAVLSYGDEVYYRSLDSRDISYHQPVLLAQGFTTSKFSLSIDKEAIRHGYLSLLLTSNTHYSPRKHPAELTNNPQPAWIATYPCSNLQDRTFVRPD